MRAAATCWANGQGERGVRGSGQRLAVVDAVVEARCQKRGEHADDGAGDERSEQVAESVRGFGARRRQRALRNRCHARQPVLLLGQVLQGPSHLGRGADHTIGEHPRSRRT